jgi:hypothetical protein
MKQLLVFGEKTFKIQVPDDAKLTFGPWSPPPRKNSGYSDHTYNPQGTLRIYQGTKDNIIGVFCNVTGFRDLSLEYAEQVAKEEGATIWKSDQDGYVREDKVSSKKEWVNPTAPALVADTTPAKKKSKSA